MPFFAFQRNYWALKLAVKFADLVTGWLSKYILKVLPFPAISSIKLFFIEEIILKNKFCDLTYEVKVNSKKLKILSVTLYMLLKKIHAKGAGPSRRGTELKK